MNTWRMHIEQGNTCFHNEAFEQAESAYIQACERAEKLLHHWLDVEEIVAALTTSYFNLADSLKCQRRYQSAQEVLVKVDSILQSEVKENTMNPERQAALLKGRSKTQLALRQIQKIVRASGHMSTHPASTWQ